MDEVSIDLWRARDKWGFYRLRLDCTDPDIEEQTETKKTTDQLKGLGCIHIEIVRERRWNIKRQEYDKINKMDTINEVSEKELKGKSLSNSVTYV